MLSLRLSTTSFFKTLANFLENIFDARIYYSINKAQEFASFINVNVYFGLLILTQSSIFKSRSCPRDTYSAFLFQREVSHPKCACQLDTINTG